MANEKNENGSKRRVANLELTDRAERVVQYLKSRYGLTQKAGLQSILEWFAASDDRIQAMILSPSADVRRGLSRLVTEAMAEDPERDWDAAAPPEVVAAVDENDLPILQEERLKPVAGRGSKRRTK